MNPEIIKKLNLTRADFCLDEPYQYLPLYFYKQGVFMAESNLFDGVAKQIIIYSKPDDYHYLPADYILAVSISEIDEGLRLNN